MVSPLRLKGDGGQAGVRLDRAETQLSLMLTPDTRLRGRSRFGAAKARNLTPLYLKNQIDKIKRD
jgi:hypothetical protein